MNPGPPALEASTLPQGYQGGGRQSKSIVLNALKPATLSYLKGLIVHTHGKISSVCDLRYVHHSSSSEEYEHWETTACLEMISWPGRIRDISYVLVVMYI